MSTLGTYWTEAVYNRTRPHLLSARTGRPIELVAGNKYALRVAYFDERRSLVPAQFIKKAFLNVGALALESDITQDFNFGKWDAFADSHASFEVDTEVFGAGVFSFAFSASLQFAGEAAPRTYAFSSGNVKISALSGSVIQARGGSVYADKLMLKSEEGRYHQVSIKDIKNIPTLYPKETPQ